MKYWKPKSVSWWSGVGLLVTAVAKSVIEKRIDAEAIMMALGAMGVIGLRGKDG